MADRRNLEGVIHSDKYNSHKTSSVKTLHEYLDMLTDIEREDIIKTFMLPDSLLNSKDGRVGVYLLEKIFDYHDKKTRRFALGQSVGSSVYKHEDIINNQDFLVSPEDILDFTLSEIAPQSIENNFRYKIGTFNQDKLKVRVYSTEALKENFKVNNYYNEKFLDHFAGSFHAIINGLDDTFMLKDYGCVKNANTGHRFNEIELLFSAQGSRK